VSTEELVGMLRTRQADAERQAEEEQRRLTRVAARINLLTEDPEMHDTDAAIVVKPLDARRVVVVSEAAEGFDDDFAPIFGRLYPTLFGELGRAGVTPVGPTYGLYDQRADGRIDVIAGVVVANDAELESSVAAVRDLPAAERAATLVHHGSMERIIDSYALLDRWIGDAGERPLGFSREVYLDCPDN